MWGQRGEAQSTPREACVYVNNMNTAIATTALPDRRAMQGRGNRGHNRDGSYPADDLPTTSAVYGGAYDGGNAGGAPPLSVGAASGAEDAVGQEAVMTQRLERAYQRIMRRLQRQLNYEEPSRVPLAQQFQLGADGLPSSHAKGDGGGGAGVARADGAMGPTRELATAGSTIVRYRADSLSGANGGEEEADADGEERALALQPCPMALRLVLRHVQTVLQNKMHLAESGSMKDCLRYTFESRALLDRLLKELPTYVQFQEPMLAGSRAAQAAGRDRVAAGGGNSIHLHELYKSFRKQPVLLPRGRYVEDRDTGAVGAELDLSQERAMAGGDAVRLDGSGVSLPRLVLPRVGLGADVASLGASHGQGEHSERASPARSDSTTPATVSLPASYGRSARLAQSLEERSEEDEVTLAMRNATHWRGGEETAGRATRLMSGSNANPPGLSEGVTGEFTLTDSTGMMLTTMTRQRRLQPKLRTLLATYSEKERQATQTTEVGTLTEENATTMVSRSAYEALEERVKELEVQLQEARNEQQSLVTELHDEETHAAGRARIIQYLRHTLVRECNTLRSQLYFAAQKEQQLVQQQQRQQQQQQQQQQPSGRERYNVPTSAAIQGTSNSHSASLAGGAAHMPPHLGHYASGVRSGRSSPRLPLAPTSPQRRVTTTGTIDSGASDANRNEVSVVSQGGPYGAPHDVGGVSLTNRPHRESSSHECGNSLAEHPAMGREATGTGGLVANDITAVQSLLDLVLLAVEKEAPLPVSLQAARDMDADDVEQLIDADAQTHWRLARAEFEQKQRTLKEMVTSMRVRNTFLLATKEKEIARLQSLTDMQFVHRAVTDAVGELRTHHRQLRRYAQDQLYTFQVNLTTTIASFSNRIKLVERTLVEHAALQNTHDAMRDLVESAGSLLLPMMTSEYMHGYHPWPIKVRNSTDPLAQAIQLQHGQIEVIHLRPQLDIFSKIYVTLHDYVMRSVIVPEMNRPAAGRTLRRLCCALMLSPVSSTEVLYAVRQHHATERELCRELARLNGLILWNVYLQRAYTERAVSALVEGGMSPNTTSLPVAPRINALAREREVLTRARTTAQKRRVGNAKEVYRLWREKQIDIYNGYPAPVFHNRLTLLTEGHNAVRARRGTQQSRLLSTSGPTAAVAHLIANPSPRLSESMTERRAVTVSPTAASLETGRSLSSTIDVQ